MKLMSRVFPRSAGAAALALAAGLAQAHEGHGVANPLHAHVDQMLAVFGLAAPHLNELVLSAVLIVGVAVWRRVRRTRRSPR